MGNTLIKKLRAYGYTWTGMKPISYRQALRSDREVYLLYPDNTEGAWDSNNKQDLKAHYENGGFFGVEYADNEKSPYLCPICGEPLTFTTIAHVDDNSAFALFQCADCDLTISVRDMVQEIQPKAVMS